MSRRPLRAPVLALLLAGSLAGCESLGLRDFDPTAAIRLPDVELPQVELPQLAEPLPTYAATDLLPTMGYTVFGEQVARVDAAHGGYDGPLGPLPEKVEVGRRPVERFDAFVRVRGSAGDYQLFGYGSTVPVQVDTLWDISVVTFQNRARRLSALRPPLAVGRMLTTPEGDVRGIALGFPALQARGVEPPAKDSVEYVALADAMRYLVVPLPEASVGSGDSLGLPAALSRMLQRTTTAPVRNTAATRLIGITSYRGRSALVGQYQGEVAYERGADRLRLAIAGHVLVDLETGMGLAAVLRLRRDGQLDGRPVDDQALIETGAWPSPGAAS
jgi:hypothetical protein